MQFTPGSVAAHVLSAVSAAPAPQPAAGNFNPQGLIAWAVANIVPLIIVGLGILIIAGAKKGKFSDNARVLSNVVMGGVLIAGASAIYMFATTIAHVGFGA